MAGRQVLAPVLNVGKLSGTRFKFSFATTMGTLFSEISVGTNQKTADSRSDEQKMSDALRALRRIARQLEITIAEASIDGQSIG